MKVPTNSSIWHDGTVWRIADYYGAKYPTRDAARLGILTGSYVPVDTMDEVDLRNEICRRAAALSDYALHGTDTGGLGEAVKTLRQLERIAKP